MMRAHMNKWQKQKTIQTKIWLTDSLFLVVMRCCALFFSICVHPEQVGSADWKKKQITPRESQERLLTTAHHVNISDYLPLDHAPPSPL